MRFQRGDPDLRHAHDEIARGPRDLESRCRAALDETQEAAETLHEEIDPLADVARSIQEDAQTLVADHGRTLVHLQRAVTGAPRLPGLGAPATPAPQSPATPGPNDEGGLVRKTGVSLLTQITTATFTSVLTLFLIRALDPVEYGVFSLALAITGLLLVPADFGISGSAARFIAESRGDERLMAAFFADALRLKVAIATVMGVALFALAGVAADIFNTPELTWPLRAAVVALVGQSLVTLFTSTFLAIGRVGSNLRLVASESSVEATASISLVLLGAGATGAATGRSIGYFVGAIFGMVLAGRAFGRTAIRPGLKPRSGYRRLVRYAGALFVVDGAFTLFNQIDVLIIGRILGSASVGLFAAPLRLCTVLHYPGLAVSNSISPRVARSLESGSDTRAFSLGLRWLIVFQAATVVPIIVWADPIVSLLLGPNYAESAPVLRALAPFIFLQGLGPLISVSVNYLGYGRQRVPIAIGAVLVNIAIDVALIPSIGVIGGAIGTSVAYAIYVPLHFRLCQRVLNIDMRPIALTALHALIAGSAMAVPLLLVGTSNIGAAGWIIGSSASLAAFVAALIVTRELRFADLRASARRIKRRLVRRA